MANSMRLLWDNAADRATVSAATETLAASNMQQDSKSTVWRSTGTTDNVKAVWTSLETVSLVSCPFCNFSPTATFRVRKTNEATATNKLIFSEVLSNAAYTKSAATIGSAITAPDGNVSALPVSDTVATSLHYVYQNANVNSGNTYTFSMFVKPSGLTRLRLENSTLVANADFNLTTGTVVTSSGGGVGNITSVGGGYFRISLTYTATSTSSQSHVMFLEDASGNPTYLGNGTSAIYSWGWQLEVGSQATSYYPTTTVVATRAIGFMDSWQSYAQDTGFVSANSAAAAKVAGLTATQAASAYTYGGGTSATSYTAALACYAVRVDIIDGANLQGYLEASRLVIGDYFSPVYDAEIGAKISYEDMSKPFRNDAGNLLTDVGARYKSIDFNLGVMQEVDRAALWKIVSYCGTSYPVFMSLYPGNSNKDLEQAYTVYGKFSSATKMAAKCFGVYEAPLTIEGI